MLFIPRFSRRPVTGNVRERSALLGGFVSAADSHASLRELWHVRHLIRQLMWRDMTVRYRQTCLGGLWALLNPGLNLALYYGVFGIMVHFSPPDYQAPYALVMLSGLVMWMLFASTVNTVGDSLLNNIHLLKKIYFPRIALAVAATSVSLVDFMVALALVLILLLVCGVSLNPVRMLLLPVCGILTTLAGWGIGCIVAVAKLRFRDIRHLIPLVIQTLFYATPVVWTPSLLPVSMQKVMILNPLYSVMGGGRYALVGGDLPSLPALLWAVSGCLMLASMGYVLFTRFEAQVTDRE